jgi:hypothetical protein
MTRPIFGVIAGVIFGAIAVAIMLPMSFPDRARAFAGAFASRFAVGLLASTVQLPMPGWASGLVVGLLVSLPDAIITKAYAPILILGTVGGAIIGALAQRFAHA